MKRTFKEKAVSKAAKMSKKHRIITPFIFLGLGLVLGFFNAGKYFYKNTKRYITLGMVLVFFFMSSSFATPSQAVENEVYLSNSEGINIEDSIVSLDSGDFIETKEENNDISIVEDEILDYDIISAEEEKALESTDNIETVTVDDFFNNIVLSELSVSDTNSEFNKDDWNLLLVNKTHPVPDNYEVPLTTLSGSMKCDERVLEPLVNMLNAAASDGYGLIVCSPYRDYKLQEKLFLRKINNYMASGKSYLDAYRLSSKDVIMPGASEHQLGLAFDIVVNNHAVLDQAFGNTNGGKWLKEHCAEYGFILRYPEGKEDITGIVYEPWHFRYVGVEAAQYIMENDITLEEFLEDL